MRAQVGQLCGLMLDLPSKCSDFTEMLLNLITRYLTIAQQRLKGLVRVRDPNTLLTLFLGLLLW